jgi:hypothetical protein
MGDREVYDPEKGTTTSDDVARVRRLLEDDERPRPSGINSITIGDLYVFFWKVLIAGVLFIAPFFVLLMIFGGILSRIFWR